MNRRKSRVARAAATSDGVMVARELVQLRAEYAEELKRSGFFGRGAGGGPGGEAPQTRANTGLVRVGRVERAAEKNLPETHDTHDALPEGNAGSCGVSIHITSTTRTTRTPRTKPATARDCAGRVPTPRADHPDQPTPREVLYRRHGDTVMWPHRSASVPGGLPDLFAAAAWLDDEGHGPVAVIAAAADGSGRPPQGAAGCP